MKKRELLIFGFIIILLSWGIWRLWPSKGKTTTVDYPTQVTPKPLLDLDLKNPQEKPISVSGYVQKWDPEKETLIVEVEGVSTTYKIDSADTKIMAVMSQNYNVKNTKLFLIDKRQQPLHWEKAFCVGDSVSVILDPSTKEVKMVIDTGQRVCGHKGVIL